MNQQQQLPQEMFSNKDGFNALSVLAMAMATTVTVFIRCDFGKRALDRRGFYSMVLLALVAAFSGNELMVWYLIAWSIVTVIQRGRAYWLSKQDGAEYRHTLYDGWPWLALSVPGLKSERIAKMVAEPATVAAVGMAATAIPEIHAVGVWLVLSGLALAFEFGVYEALMARRVDVGRDAQHEMNDLADRLRRGQ